MLTLEVKDGDRLHFEWPGAEAVRVLCKRMGPGEMMLLRSEPATPWFYKTLAYLKDAQFSDIWPGVSLRYFQNTRGLWKVSFDLPKTVKVTREKVA